MDPVSKTTEKTFEKVFDCVWDLIIRQLGYIVNYKRNVKELKKRIEDLERARQRVSHQVEEDERNGKEMEADVSNWLNEVDGKITEQKTFQEDEGHTKTGLFVGCPSFFRFRHRLGKQAKEITSEVKSLLDTSRFNGVSYQSEPMSMVAALSNVGYEIFESRTRMIERIKAALEDSTVRLIGVHGPGGVGKTTLVKEIGKIAKKEKLFEVVVIVSVTRNPDPTKIQGEIADGLGLRFEEETEIGRADRLRKRIKKLRKEKGNILVILDDLWGGLNLDNLGIPYDDDDDDDGFHETKFKSMPSFKDTTNKEKSFGKYKACKILLTSRNKEVLSVQMGIKTKSVFPVGLLDKNEAETLFKKLTVGVTDKNSEFENLAAEFTKKCRNLPMAIVAVGKALRNKRFSEWKEVLEQLNSQGFMGVDKSLEFPVKLSYDNLESEELKSIFLFCARNPRPLFMDLVKHCIGLGTFQGVYTIKEARSRIDRLIQKLKDSGLLLDNDLTDYFRMHDLTRDAALSIASKEQNVFTLRDGKLGDWPDKEELERCTVISLHNIDIIDELPEGINYLQLKVFHIDNNDPSLRIPDNFFEGMRKLRVLILNGIHMTQLPSSIKCLTNLRMLCLERCVLGDNLSIIGELKKLRILSLSGSQIEKLPGEFGQLDKLQLLDISNCSRLKEIPPNVISSLTSLEELYMRNNQIQWKVKEDKNQSQIADLDELQYLHQLKTLDICISNATILPWNLFFDKLDDYKIVIGDFKMLSVGDFKMPDKYEVSRTLALQLKEGINIHNQKGIKMLFRIVENLMLGELNGVRNAFDELNLEGFPFLKHLSIVNNFELEYIINSKEFLHPQIKAFPKLESLCLHKLENMEILFGNRLTDDSLRNLKTIKIQICSRLKNLFSLHLVKLLTKLEIIEVSECNSLKEIVVGQMQGITNNDAEDNKVEFPQLRSLNLQSLPNFMGFYTISQLNERQEQNSEHSEITVEDGHAVSSFFSLFSEQVIIPEIESLELSSINIHKIWGYQPSSSFCFQTLTKLKVNDCDGLKYLFSFSIAKNLKNLKDLSISRCEMMEEIFDPEGISMAEAAEAIIFPKLEKIELTDMERLRTIWHSQVSFLGSFRNMESVVIEECEKLVNVFPRHMIGKFQNLGSLEVVNCKSLKEIFDLNDPPEVYPDGNEIKLRRIVIKDLPNLKDVWNANPEGILNFKNMQSIEVQQCPNLKHLLPVSVAKGLQKNLERLAIFVCDGMEEIVASEEGSGTASIPFVFPELTDLFLIRLPRLRSFYQGRYTLEWKALKNLGVMNCEKLEAFTTDTVQFQQAISNLDYVVTGLKEAEWLRHCIGNYRMHNLNELRLFSLNSIDYIHWFLHRIPNLQYLGLFDSYFKEFIPYGSRATQEKIGTAIQLKGLWLSNLPALQNIGLERDPVLQRVERLVIQTCSQLIKLAPSSVSFTYLTYLEVSECDKFLNLMASSTAKSLVQLTTLKVRNCKVMEEIVVEEGNEDEESATKIVFNKLTTMELVALANLTSFCTSNSHAFDFPSLENLLVMDCPEMKIFTEGVINAPNLQKVCVLGGEEERKWHWEGDLNTTIKKVFTLMVSFQYSEYLKLSDHPELEQVWHGKISVVDNCFSNLKTLVVMNCEFLSRVIPSHLLPYLNNLEELSVESCSLIEVVFDLNDTNVTRTGGSVPRLKKLSLDQLPNLEYVWNKDPRGILSHQFLKELYVDECKNLKNLFPASVATEGSAEISAKDETGREGETKNLITFPGVTLLRLWNLPELKCIYPGMHNLEWPKLKQLDVYHCDKLKMFPAKGQIHFPIDRHALVSAEEVMNNLEELSLSKEETMIIEQGQFQEDLLHRVKFLKLRCFHGSSDIFPYEFLRKVPLPNIEKLRVSCSRFKDIFLSQRPHVDYHTKILSQLKELELNYLPELHSIGFEHPWVDPFLKNLETLQLIRCHRLINLASSTVSFSNLRDLTVSECDEMAYLFTTSTAKSLSRLKSMSVKECESIEEIVSDEREEPRQEEIIFSQLQTLYLDTLPNIRSFYGGTFTLYFPSLTKVSVIQCPGMKVLCQGHNIAPNLFAVNFQQDIYAVTWEGDLNATLKKASLTMSASDVKLSDHPELEEMWHGVVPVPDWSFINLKSLTVESCQFLSNVIPGHLIPFLNNLEELKVSNCDFVKIIFDVTDITRDKAMINVRPLFPLPFSLKKLALQKLPNLEYVWNKDPQGIVNHQTLREVYVGECKGLKSLFPACMPRDLLKLETLYVESCEELVEIVAVDEEGAAKNFVFPCLTSLTLEELPELNHFYPGKHELECPKLKELHVAHCDKLKMFTSDSQSYLEAHPEDQVQPQLIFVEKAIPNVEELSLNGKETMLSWHEELPESLLQNLKFLWLICFHNVGEADILPFDFLHKVPNIEKLGILCSGFKQIFPSQALEVECTTILAQLKELRLVDLPGLKSIGLEHSWLHPLFESLENLRIYRCPGLPKLVQSAVSFSNLKELDIYKCHELDYLFTYSTATSLGRLKKMSIKHCKSIKEVVVKEKDESAEDEIMFEQLKELSLRHLSSLVSFYNGNSTLKFPSLYKMITDQCPRMKIFSQGLISAPLLKEIQVSPKAYHTRWEGDFKTTVDELFKEKVSFEYSEHLKFSKYSQLEQVWHGELSLSENCFRKLKNLVMENLKFLSEAVPSHLLPYLKNLEELQVRSCTSLEVIFNLKDMKITKGIAFHLKKLTLDRLPSMKHVWNKDPQGVLRFETLQDVNVTDCEGLKVLFPTSMAKNLVKLKTLIIETCEAMVEIVGKEDAVAGTTAKFEFPCLNLVTLSMMPKLKCFYSGKHNLQCPALKHLRVYHCGKLEIFTSEAHPEDHVGISIESQPLFMVQKVIPNLEELSLSEKEIMMLWHGDYAANLLDRVIRLQLYCFHNMNEGDKLPFGFLQKVPNIETLAMACGDSEEIFPSQAVDFEVMSILAKLKGLTLENLSKLNSIGLEHPWLGKLRENLKILEVCRCPRLTNLIQSPVSFSNLREMLLNKCDGLVYLFTSSTAKSLVNLKKISVEECQSIKEIVIKEGEESTHDEIIFEKLRELSLKSLSSLASFCTGNSVLKFPSLVEVIITQCPKMKFFSQGLISAPMLISIQGSLDKDDLLWEGDLNATVEKMFVEKAQRDFIDATEGEENDGKGR